MDSRLRIPNVRANAVAQAVGRWDFSAHDYTDEELVHGALVMFEHAFTMPEVSDFVITSGSLTIISSRELSLNSESRPYRRFSICLQSGL
jgi:3',5'-cyclic-nucleotide phosphodiesterase